VPIGLISIVAVLLCAVALGIWWWTLKSASDPIDANPVDAYGLVVSSPSCTAGGLTTVTVSGTTPPVTATLNACGYRVGEQLPIQYLAGHPQTVRLTGTATAGSSSMAARLLPIGILTAGVIAVLATVSLLVERRRSRHQAAPAGRAGARSRRGTPDAAGAAGSGAAGAGTAATPPSDPLTGGTDGGGTTPGGVPLPAGPATGAAGAAGPTVAPVPAGSLVAPTIFPENVYGTGYVADGGLLFTHTRPEPPEPAGAPVELSGPTAEPDPHQG
jgi:hypothetical protein